MYTSFNLTPREIVILLLVFQTKCRQVIAVELCIAVSTVDKHINNIHKKTNTNLVGELMLVNKSSV